MPRLVFRPGNDSGQSGLALMLNGALEEWAGPGDRPSREGVGNGVTGRRCGRRAVVPPLYNGPRRTCCDEL